MTFNTAVSGLRAADDDMSVISNNVANASTVGFKASRAEFADVYAASAQGVGGDSIGSGVLLNNVAQQFSQGTVSFTENNLDMAVNGSGFFILDNNGATSYSRAGYFGVDQDGRLVNNSGLSLQGYQANASGALSGQLDDIYISSDNLPPRQTLDVSYSVNLDARETEPAERGSVSNTTGAEVGVAQAGSINGYGTTGGAAETWTFTDADGNVVNYQLTANRSAANIESDLDIIDGVIADSSTTLSVDNVALTDALVELTVNGVVVGRQGDTATDVAFNINTLTTTTLPGITASIDTTGTIVTINSNRGDDITIALNNTGNGADTVDVTGTQGAGVALTGATGGNATVGGEIEISMEDGMVLSTSGTGNQLLAVPVVQNAFVNNVFDPTDQETYNHATSANIYDSLGNPHIMTLFFVKESGLRQWAVYAQVDGQDVGNPNTAAPQPQDTEPTQARFTLVFNADGTLNDSASDEIEITYWTPVDENGNFNGALGPDPAGEFPQPDPPTSSNFRIALDNTTQFGSPFSVNNVAQDGYTTGRLVGLDINSEGLIFSRYTNGQARTLAQVGMANFNNLQGLQAIGDTSWVETFESGGPITGAPGSGSLGVVQSGALEESNVELSQELVKMIIAQRNFQANAKTIQTADAITQAVINIR